MHVFKIVEILFKICLRDWRDEHGKTKDNIAGNSCASRRDAFRGYTSVTLETVPTESRLCETMSQDPMLLSN